MPQTGLSQFAMGIDVLRKNARRSPGGSLVQKISVNLSSLPSEWATPCKMAIKELNRKFKEGRIGVELVAGPVKVKGPSIDVKVDPSIKNNMVHGKTSAAVSGSGQLIKSTIGLPKTLEFAVPWGDTGMRPAGAGARSVIAGHEFVHALMHHNHNSHLMAQTLSVEIGDDAKDDKLKAFGISMPPLQLSNETISKLRALWK
jgi:hypothetical protein